MDFPAAGFYSSGITNLQAKTAQDDQLAATKQLPGAAASTELTISTGSITPTRARHTVDTEGDASTDNLDVIDLTNVPDGSILILSIASNSRTVTVRHAQGATGQIFLSDSANFTLANTTQRLILERSGDAMVEVDRSLGALQYSAEGQYGYAKGADQATVDGGSDDTTYISPDKMEGSKYNVCGKHMQRIMAGGMTPATTNGGTPSTTETTTNKLGFRAISFDKDTTQYAWVTMPMPKSWDHTTGFTFVPIWTAASGAGDVVWGCQAVMTRDDDPLDAAYGTGQTSTDTLTTALDLDRGPESTSITPAGTAADFATVHFRFYRLATDAGDTLSAAALLIGVELYWNVDYGTDAAS
jgi:hypothetical protein